MVDRSVVTGVAGFLGSHLAERLLQTGHHVVGIDKFLANYAREFKKSNLSSLRDHPHFRFVEKDLCRLDLSRLLEGVSYVFHLAAQPGVRSSWGREFAHYTENNILATQKLLEACKEERLRNLCMLHLRPFMATRRIYPCGRTAEPAQSLLMA